MQSGPQGDGRSFVRPMPGARVTSALGWGSVTVLSLETSPTQTALWGGLEDSSPRQVPRSDLNFTFLVASRRHGDPTRSAQQVQGLCRLKGEEPWRADRWTSLPVVTASKGQSWGTVHG